MRHLIVNALLAVLLAAGNAQAGDVWVSPGGLSLHNRGGYNERNAGALVEYQEGPHAVALGGYKNSLGRQSLVVGYRYMPYQYGPLSFGAQAVLVNNYAARDGGFIPVALPVAAIDVGPVGVVMTAWPALRGSPAGAAVMFRVRVF